MEFYISPQSGQFYMINVLENQWLSVTCNEEQIITGYPIDGAMGISGGGRVRKLSVVCLHNNGIVCEWHPGYYIALWDTQTPPQCHLYC